jgi:hypothetical protein
MLKTRPTAQKMTLEKVLNLLRKCNTRESRQQGLTKDWFFIQFYQNGSGVLVGCDGEQYMKFQDLEDAYSIVNTFEAWVEMLHNCGHKVVGRLIKK